MTPALALRAIATRAGFVLPRRANDLFVFGIRNDTNSDLFDDVVGYAWCDTDDGPLQVEVNRGTVDPGKAALLDPMHPRGTFRMAEGRHPLCWQAGLHHQDATRPAFVQVPGAKIKGHRDNDRDAVFEELVATDDVQGLNFHDGMDESRPTQKVGRYSFACWVSSKRFVQRGLELLRKQQAAGMGGKVSAHLVRREKHPEAAVLFAAVGVP